MSFEGSCEWNNGIQKGGGDKVEETKMNWESLPSSDQSNGFVIGGGQMMGQEKKTFGIDGTQQKTLSDKQLKKKENREKSDALRRAKEERKLANIEKQAEAVKARLRKQEELKRLEEEKRLKKQLEQEELQRRLQDKQRVKELRRDVNVKRNVDKKERKRKADRLISAVDKRKRIEQIEMKWEQEKKEYTTSLQMDHILQCHVRSLCDQLVVTPGNFTLYSHGSEDISISPSLVPLPSNQVWSFCEGIGQRKEGPQMNKKNMLDSLSKGTFVPGSTVSPFDFEEGKASAAVARLPPTVILHKEKEGRALAFSRLHSDDIGVLRYGAWLAQRVARLPKEQRLRAWNSLEDLVTVSEQIPSSPTVPLNETKMEVEEESGGSGIVSGTPQKQQRESVDTVA